MLLVNKTGMIKIISHNIEIQEILQSPLQLEHFAVLAEPIKNLVTRLIVGLLQCGQLYMRYSFTHNAAINGSFGVVGFVVA